MPISLRSDLRSTWLVQWFAESGLQPAARWVRVPQRPRVRAVTRVPAEHLAAPMFEPARHEGPLSKFPLFTLAGILMVGFPLGVARRALDEFTELARASSAGHPRKRWLTTATSRCNSPGPRQGLQAARAFVFDVVGELWDTCCGGDPPSLQQRARMVLAANQAMRAGVEVVDVLFRLAGAEAVFAGQPLERCFWGHSHR